MSLDNVSYVANPHFAAPRAYWRGILIGYASGATFSLVGDVIHISNPFSGGLVESFITLDTRFVPWSSNRWTLDHIFKDQRSFINGTGPHFFHVNIDCGILGSTGKFGAGFTYDAATAIYIVDLPPAPSSYWLPEIP